jgi:hypothetical protein
VNSAGPGRRVNGVGFTRIAIGDFLRFVKCATGGLWVSWGRIPGDGAACVYVYSVAAFE